MKTNNSPETIKNETLPTEQEFAQRYAELCRELGFQIQPQIGFKQQIDGTFTIGVQLRIDKIEAPK